MSGKKLVPILVMAGTALLYAVFIHLRTAHLRKAGLPVYWLEEFWAPTGFLALVMVTFVEKMVGHGKEAKETPRKKAKPKAK